MCQHHPLGLGGGAAGVLNDSQRMRVNGDLGALRGCFAHQIAPEQERFRRLAADRAKAHAVKRLVPGAEIVIRGRLDDALDLTLRGQVRSHTAQAVQANQDAGAAVARLAQQLLLVEQRIAGHHHRAGLQRAVEGDDRLWYVGQ